MRALYLIPGLTCLFLGGVFLLVFRSGRTKQETSERSLTGQAWGRLTETGERVDRDIKNRSHTVYFGIYEYDTADGQHISSASAFGYYSPEVVPGAQGKMVKLRYNPKNPTEFALEEEQDISKTVWPKFRKVGIGLMILGILLTAGAVAAILGVFDPLLEGLMS